MKEPEVSVGIISAVEIDFTLHAPYMAKGETVSSRQKVTFFEGGIRWKDQIYQSLTFTPIHPDASFTLEDVTIGINFHWERKERQIFSGKLKLVVHEAKIWAINEIPVEDYLVSVISSEMNAQSKLEFLKAHAVISRSWLLAQIEKRTRLSHQLSSDFHSFIKSEGEYIRWYDREDHTIFDVCADDHCQRYQGITKASHPTVALAVKSTRGQVLKWNHQICDARFSKCCGGVSEAFETCWESKSYPYLSPVRDAADETDMPDLRNEDEATHWIRSTPSSFCHTTDGKILLQILNHFDQETTQFYRWKVSYTGTELTALITERTQTDFGEIIDLIPIERGPSGRISKLQIIGSKKTLTVGKELEIRRILSRSHLFSSAFVVEKESSDSPVTTRFTLYGAGWGHGVGLCQIGAAVMGEQGYGYRDILLHYYRSATIESIY